MSNASVGGVAGDRLRAFVERIERLEEEKVAIARDIREVYLEAKAVGFDGKTMRRLIALRKLSAAERDEQEALLDIYKAALGMLADTPLGEAAARRLAGKRPPEDDDAPADPRPAAPAGAAPAELPPDLDGARARGRDDALAGRPVTDNPFPARDPRRAAYDEAWCQAAGSDGMEIPEAWRRAKKPRRPADDDAGSGAKDGDGDDAPGEAA